MKTRVNEWVGRFPNFHALPSTDQIIRLGYFHTIEDKRESVSTVELGQLFAFADLPRPRNLAKLLAYLCGKGVRLNNNNGEFSLQRDVRQAIDKELQELSGAPPPPKIGAALAFEFAGRVFKDNKVEVLIEEARKCYATECWNACGILMQIVLERTLDSANAQIKATAGLKAKLNVGISTAGIFSQTIADTLKELKNAKLVGDIVAHHSTIVLDKPDIDLVAPSLRMLIKEVTTV